MPNNIIPPFMPRPPTTVPKGKVAEAFLKAGSTNREATIAQSYASRFDDLSDAKTKKAIENQFKFLRTAVAEGGDVARANDVMLGALAELGSFDQLTKLSKTALGRLGLKGDLTNVPYKQCVENVVKMADWDSPARKLAAKHGLDVVDVTWEDTGRTVGSSGGRNITDFNLSIEVPDAITGKVESHRTPILRYPNFGDKSADIETADFKINVGNAKGTAPKAKSLEDVLKKPWLLMSDPTKWPLKKGGKNVGLFVEGVDEKALVSAQAAFLPVTKEGGRATYTPMAYAYSSHFDKKHGPQPSTMTIMVTHQGASLSITGKKDEDKFGWLGGGYGEPLHFNEDGKRAPLTAERASTSSEAGAGNAGSFEGGASNADQLNRVLIIQIPLIPEHDRPRRMFMMAASMGGIALESMPMRSAGGGASDVENAVVGHGPIDGPFDETMGKGWKRDDTLPVRVTVQLTKATSNGIVTDKEMKALKGEIDAVYKGADRIGSLVQPEGTNPGPFFGGPIAMVGSG